MNSNCVTPNPFQDSVLTMMDGLIYGVVKTEDCLSFNNPANLERYAFIEIASKLRVTFAAACFQEAFDEYIKLKHTLHGSSTSEKIWCYLVCKDTDLKNHIELMKKFLKKTHIPFTYQFMSDYLVWTKKNPIDNSIQNITRFIETL